MGGISDNPLVAGLPYRNGTCVDATAFVQFQAVKLSGPNTYVPCETTDDDSVVAGIVLADRRPGDPLTIPVCASFRACPILSDGSDTVDAGDASTGYLTLSSATAGYFTPGASGMFRALSDGEAVAGTVVLAQVLL